MSETIKVRKIHLDYAGADGPPKPMTWLVTVDPSQSNADYEDQARRVFGENFPEWKLRSCRVEEDDLEVETEALRPLFAEAGVWGPA